MGTQRQLGHSFERAVASVLKVCFPGSVVERGLQSRDARVCDVEGTPFRVECKRRKKASDLSYNALHAFLERNEKDGKRFDDNRIPMLISKLVDGKGREPIIHIYLRDLVSLVERHFYKADDNVVRIHGSEDE